MLQGYRIVLVEDDPIMGGSVVQRLELEGASVQWLRQMVRALGALRTPAVPVDAVICDIRLPDGDGEQLFTTLCETTTPPPFLFITGHGGVDQAVRLMQAGASDYVTKPFEMAVFLERLSMLLTTRHKDEPSNLIGISPAAQRVQELARKAAETDLPVLIRGGPGTGKGIVARRIHEQSSRRSAPFVSVNIAREPHLENALFGPEGAFARVGEGTVFLSALSRLPGALQHRLLAALDEGSVKEMAGGRTGRFEGRVISACGQDLEQIVARDGFLPDLFYRLSQVEIPIPPLADRPEDAVWLAHQIFERLNARRDAPLAGMSRLAESAIAAHDWPGGGRELRSRMARGVEIAGQDHLQPSDLFPERIAAGGRILSLAEAREQAERRQILQALEAASGQVGQAARLLDVSRTTLWDKMRKLGIAADQD